jgi:hypothetical protein
VNAKKPLPLLLGGDIYDAITAATATRHEIKKTGSFSKPEQEQHAKLSSSGSNNPIIINNSNSGSINNKNITKKKRSSLGEKHTSSIISKADMKAILATHANVNVNVNVGAGVHGGARTKSKRSSSKSNKKSNMKPPKSSSNTTKGIIHMSSSDVAYTSTTTTAPLNFTNTAPHTITPPPKDTALHESSTAPHTINIISTSAPPSRTAIQTATETVKATSSIRRRHPALFDRIGSTAPLYTTQLFRGNNAPASASTGNSTTSSALHSTSPMCSMPTRTHTAPLGSTARPHTTTVFTSTAASPNIINMPNGTYFPLNLYRISFAHCHGHEAVAHHQHGLLDVLGNIKKRKLQRAVQWNFACFEDNGGLSSSSSSTPMLTKCCAKGTHEIRLEWTTALAAPSSKVPCTLKVDGVVVKESVVQYDDILSYKNLNTTASSSDEATGVAATATSQTAIEA